ncbi:hypothetical protein [Aquamicrobium defluvii]|uniref:DUF4440 domain-containing protein n=1 Tax=Aquamicrobium defluvii TaxID=69279 RepID=A0A011SWJ4_9HYPH|nr:hypothetical protein [Aquamicrobium defluvii]EXL03629.1 hypothetical protein BG36_11545 [Aquamicrobium defluvii]EZQ15260.1 hypothetical protein CF98_12655 [Halopseudomonas bauzanensis]
MRKSFLGIAAATLVALAAPLPVLANPVNEMNSTLDTLFGDHARYRTFFDNLKKAVAAGDKATVAAMIDYPFQARIGGKSLKIRDTAHFVADYDQIITAKVKHAVQGQTYETLFANWQGVMVGDGEIWFSGVGDADVIKITAIND